MDLRKNAQDIVKAAIKVVQPDEAVKKALADKTFEHGRVLLVAVGKAAWQMAAAAKGILGSRIEKGIVITKYGHSQGPLKGMEIWEAGHPLPDENSFQATEEALKLVKDLTEQDTVLFLVSGGGSALFEKPLVSKEELEDITKQLLWCGAGIVEINTIRKRLSAVKGGKFGEACAPARVFSIVLSDILGDPLDMIASGPACPDSATAEEAREIVRKYNLSFSAEALKLMEEETPKTLKNVETQVTGSVIQLCEAAKREAEGLGYKAVVLTDCMDCEAREAGAFLGAIARTHQDTRDPLAFIAGGETVVHVTGQGKGGRNQELALAAADKLAGLSGCAVFSVGSDGTDGPTDAAGGFVDGTTKEALDRQGLSIYEILKENDAYRALESCGGLIMTGPTGTNVNDVSVLLIRPEM